MPRRVPAFRFAFSRIAYFIFLNSATCRNNINSLSNANFPFVFNIWMSAVKSFFTFFSAAWQVFLSVLINVVHSGIKWFFETLFVKSGAALLRL